MLKINRLYIRFQLGNSYGNICGKESPLIYACSIRQFIWEYLSGSGKGKSTGLYVLGGAGNANASNKPLALCTRWLEDPWIARFGEPFAAQISDDF